MLVRAKHPSKVATEPNNEKMGMSKCDKSCKACPHINVTNEFRGNYKDESFKMTGDFNCNTIGVIYLVSCNKCSIQYVGQTTRKFQLRVKEHLSDIKNHNKMKAIGVHFNSTDHSIDNFRVQIVEKVLPNNTNILLERERLWIRTLVTKDPNGLNSHD